MGKKPTLVVMAAGMGSRYGGLKQVDPVGPDGEVIMEYSIFDAVRAGFEDVVIVLKPEMAQEFAALAGDRVARRIPVRYAFQEVRNLPGGYAVPEGRAKPWGTAQAVLAAREAIEGSFAVINADDYYGPDGFRALAGFLSANRPGAGFEKQQWAMVGYRIENTVTRHGSVARGVCEVDGRGHLVRIIERTQIMRTDESAEYTEDGGRTRIRLPKGTPVSMNLWGFTSGFLDAAEEGFHAFLDENLPADPLTCEYQLPTVVQSMIDSGEADVTVLDTGDQWYGVTYRQDKPAVVEMLADRHAEGAYPTPLWGSR